MNHTEGRKPSSCMNLNCMSFLYRKVTLGMVFIFLLFLLFSFPQTAFAPSLFDSCCAFSGHRKHFAAPVHCDKSYCATCSLWLQNVRNFLITVYILLFCEICATVYDKICKDNSYIFTLVSKFKAFPFWLTITMVTGNLHQWWLPNNEDNSHNALQLHTIIIWLLFRMRQQAAVIA